MMTYRLQGCKKSAVIGWMAGMLLLAGCTQDKLADASQGEMLPEGKYPVTFTATGLEIAPTSRATADGTWDGTEAVAVKIGSEVKNYVADGSGASTTLKAAKGVIPFYWKSTNENKDVSAWYCGTEYNASLPSSWMVKPDQSSDENYQKSDFLYAKGTLSFNGNQSLTFYHQVAKVVVHVLSGDETPTNMNITEMKANNMWTAPTEDNNYGSGDVNSPSDITPHKFDAGEITLPSNSKATPLASYKFLIVPQAVNKDQALFTITVEGYNKFVYTPTKESEWKAGTEYTYYITIKGNKVTATVSTSIGWTDSGTTGSGNVEL